MSIDAKLKELTKRRKEWVRINRENGFEKGIKSILTKLYPKKAHFIYELLQNSEDAGAHYVKFLLGAAGLGYEHDGDKQFTLMDIDSITSIGSSTKFDDNTKIGKFGVGFKAVYSYTKTPEIHSGEFDFKIEDMVVPITDNVRPQRNTKNTMFYFPFDIPEEKPAEQAVTEIGHTLRYLDDITLLFLKNIKRIEYEFTESSYKEFANKFDLELFGDKPGSIEMTELDEHQVQIKSIDPTGKVRITDWLKFEKEVEVQNEEDRMIKCRIAVAYELYIDGNDGSSKIVPCSPGKVCVFFPAEKETSNLRFHLHAPFASTVSRDSIRACPANDALRDQLTELVADSLMTIRDKGLLTVRSLAVFPNNNDNLLTNSPFYEPFQRAIIHSFKTQELTPCKDGGYAKSEQLIRGPSKISELLGDAELHQLFQKPIPIWATNAAMVNSLEDRFLTSLQIREFSWKEVVRGLRGDLALPGEFKSNDQIFENFVKSRTDSWLNNFYAFLGEANSDYYVPILLSSLQIIRITNKNGIDHVLPKDALLPPDEWILNNDGIPMVKQEVREMRTNYHRRYLPVFFEKVGVRKYNSTTIIEQRLEHYAQNRPYNPLHLAEMTAYIHHLKQNPQDKGIFMKYAFLYADSYGDPGKNFTPGDLCLDVPYLETGLISVYSCHRKPKIWSGYAKSKEFSVSDFIEFVTTLGIMRGLKIEKREKPSILLQKQFDDDYKYVKKTYKAIIVDYSIEHLENYLNANSIEINKLIWDTLISAPSEVAQAQYRPNNSCPVKTYKSSLIQYLRMYKWIPDVEGNLFTPEKIDPERIDRQFRIDYSNGLLKEIGFGAEEEKKTIEYQQKNSSAIAIGFNSVEQAERFANIAKMCEDLGKAPEEIEQELKVLTAKRIPEFPEDNVSNQERRKQKIQEKYDESSLKVYDKKEVRVHVSKNTIDPRTWLLNHYTNRHGEMVCQICNQEMPFKKRDGTYYFEAVEIFTKFLLEKENEANYLALCPLCSAKYQEFVKQDEKAMVRLKQAILEAQDENREIDIVLDDNTPKASIRFIESHLFDLKIMLETLTNEK